MHPNDKAWDPVPEGTVRPITIPSGPGDPDAAIPWEALIRWMDCGWTQLVGLRVGNAHGPRMAKLMERADEKGDIHLRPGLEPEPLPPITGEALARILATAVRAREEYEAAQLLAMVWRDIESGALAQSALPETLGGREFHMLRNKDGVHDRVVLAGSLYRFFLDIGSRSPTEDVAKAMQLSRSSAARDIAQARKLGVLGPARHGAAGEFTPRRGME